MESMDKVDIDLDHDTDETSLTTGVIRLRFCSESWSDVAPDPKDHPGTKLAGSDNVLDLPSEHKVSAGRSAHDLETSSGVCANVIGIHREVADIVDGKDSDGKNNEPAFKTARIIGNGGGPEDETVQTQPSTGREAADYVAAATSAAGSRSDRMIEEMTTVECSKHAGREVEYFCQIHNAVGCSVCMTVEHRVCNVAFVPEVSKNVSSSQEYKSVRSNIDNLRSHILGLHQTAVANKARNKEYLHKGEIDINNFVSNIDANVLKMKSQCLNSLQKAHGVNGEILNKCSHQCLQFAEELDILKTYLNRLQSGSSHEPKLFITMKTLGARLSTLEEILIKTSQEVELPKYEFIPDECLSNPMFNSSLGAIRQEFNNEESNVTKTTIQGTAVIYEIQSDEYTVLVKGFCPLFENLFLITDAGNMAIKAVKLLNRTMVVIAHHMLSSIPFEIAVLDQYAFVTMPDELAILCFHISLVKKLLVKESVEFEFRQSIKTDGICTGLAVSKSLHISPVLLVSVQKEHKVCVQFRTVVDGSVLKEIDNSQLGCSIFLDPAHLAIKNDVIYVSDFNGNSIVCLSYTGQLLWVFTARMFERPLGICVGSDENLYVCCLKSLNLTCISPNGKLLWHKTIQNGDLVLRPRLVIQHKGSFYLVTGNELDHKIQVFLEKSILQNLGANF